MMCGSLFLVAFLKCDTELKLSERILILGWSYFERTERKCIGGLVRVGSTERDRRTNGRHGMIEVCMNRSGIKRGSAGIEQG